MFDLEQSIIDWRQQMIAAGIQAPVPLEELEGHLRDEIERQIQAGSTTQQAFDLATRQIGRAAELKGEFAKAGETGLNLLWVFSTGLACAGCWMQFGQAPATAFVYCILLAGLIAAAFIDFKHFIIPDQITIGGTLAGLLCSVLVPQLHGQKLFGAGMLQSLLGIGAGAGVLYFILRAGKFLYGRQRLQLPATTRIIFTETSIHLPEKEIPYAELFHRKSDAIELHAQSVQLGKLAYREVPVRLTSGRLQIGGDNFDPGEAAHMEAVGGEIVLPREAMGLGDVKFMAAIGAFLGWQAVIFSLVAASLFGSLAGIGLIAARRREWSARLPFGPYLALAAAVWIFGGRYLVATMFSH
jgi:leader peptidase (prepilin peptidase)/N-methyltransferase